MSPATTTSDSEDDLDYVPPADEHDSDTSEDEQDRVDDGAAESVPAEDLAEQKKRRDALWASFQASVPTPTANGNAHGSGDGRGPTAAKRVKIEKTYLFAGKHVTEVVEVPEDSEEVKRWPRAPSRSESVDAPAPAPEGEGETKGTAEGRDGCPEPRRPSSPAVDLSPTTPPPLPPTNETTMPVPAAERPGPRKPRTVLPSLPGKASHAKKITTLDKSAMDWRAHVATGSSDVRDELDANRRGGGYLDKVDFLRRVQDRRDDAFEANKSNKRRRT